MFSRTGVVAVVVGLLVAGFAWAETTTTRTVLPAVPSGEGMSAEEMATEAERLLDDMRSSMSEGFEQLQDARQGDGEKGPDVRRIGCVNEALTAIKGLVRLAEQSYVSLRDAAARGETHTAQHEFVKLSLASSKVGEMRTQLMACGGPSVSTETDGEAELKVLSDTELPLTIDGAPAWFSTTDVILQTPVSASPFI